MNNNVLIENEKKRLDYSLSRLMCLAMFAVWQMGSVYCTGSVLSVDSKALLQTDLDNVTALMIAGYLLSILWMLLFPRKYVYAVRLSAVSALIFFGGWNCSCR